jgi:hypothetical protein
MRQELIDWVENVITDELDWSYNEHGTFPSQYHGIAIIAEELDESQEELQRLINGFEKAWESIRNNLDTSEQIKQLGETAKLLACEAIQTAAMAQKFIECSEGWKK